MPTEGLFRANASDLAVEAPTKSGPRNPGPAVYAIPSISSKASPDSSIVRRKRGIIFFKWSLEAISGTTPPYSACFEA